MLLPGMWEGKAERVGTTSQLQVYRRSELESADCLHRYRAIYLDGVNDDSDYALRGQAFAAIKHAYIVRLVDRKLESDDEEARAAFVEGIAKSHCPDRLIPEVRVLWERHAQYFSLPLDRYVTAEEKQLPMLCKQCRQDWLVHEYVEAGNVCPSCGSADVVLRPFSFTPDLVLAHPERNELEVIDDKTFYVPLTEIQARQSFQGRYYIRFAMDRWPKFSSYRMTFSFVRYGTPVSVVYQASDLADLELEVNAAVAKIQEAAATGHYPATPGPSCSYCELECPVVSHPAILPKRFLDHSTAVKAAELVLAGEKMLKVVKKSLKEYVAAYGPIDVQGVEFDNRPTIQRSYPVTPVIEALRKWQAAGALSPDEGLTVSHSSLSKVFKKYPEMEQALAPVVQAKTTYRFSARKPGVGDEDDE